MQPGAVQAGNDETGDSDSPKVGKIPDHVTEARRLRLAFDRTDGGKESDKPADPQRGSGQVQPVRADGRHPIRRGAGMAEQAVSQQDAPRQQASDRIPQRL